jgi:uncharacterized protein YbaR (Trm112 family)
MLVPISCLSTLPFLQGGVAGSPSGFWARIIWVISGRKPLVKEVIETQWPEYDAIILNCPKCNQPCATSKDHHTTMETCFLCSGTGSVCKKAGWTTLKCASCNGTGDTVKEPLTIDRPITCPYCRTTFNVSEGTITIA